MCRNQQDQNKLEETLIYFINDVAEWFEDDNPFEEVEVPYNSCPDCGEQVDNNEMCNCQE